MAGGLGRRIGSLEAEVERRVEEELDAVLTLLEERLSREEFRRVLEIVADKDGEE